MATTTSTLTELSLKQSNSKNAMSLRRMLPSLLINAVIPFLINLLAQSHMSAIDALLLASSVPALYTLGNLIVKRRVDALGLTVVAGLLLSAAFALLFNSPRLLLLQGSMVNGLFGAVILLSLPFLSRPILFYLVRSITTQNDAQHLASFNADWSFPQIRTFYRVLSIVWGCVTIGQLLLVGLLAFTLPISLMVGIGPILNFAIIIPAAHWSIVYFRRNKRIFEQPRKERDAANA